MVGRMVGEKRYPPLSKRSNGGMAWDSQSGFCATVREAGKYADTGRRDGLYLQVARTGGKSWTQRVVIRGRRRELGLGSLKYVSLDEARELAFNNRRIARTGDGDPMADRARARGVPTLGELSEMYVETHGAGWKAKGAVVAFRNSLATHCRALLGRRVDSITPGEIRDVLTHVRAATPKMSEHIKGRLSKLFVLAVAEGWRPDNPVTLAWAAVPKRATKVKAHGAIGYGDLAPALARIRETDAWVGAKLALAFIILTATRSGEARAATWDEFNLAEKLWTIPSGRTKTGDAHTVPLSTAAIEILTQARQYSGSDGEALVFPSSRGNLQPANALTRALGKAGLASTVHGFRATFRTWAQECTSAPHAVAELCLGHRVGSSVERAYARGELIEKRRQLMQSWAAFISAC